MPVSLQKKDNSFLINIIIKKKLYTCKISKTSHIKVENWGAPPSQKRGLNDKKKII